MGKAGQWVSSPLGPPSRNRAGSTRVFSSPPSNTPTPSRRDTPLYAAVVSRKVVEPLPDVDEVIDNNGRKPLERDLWRRQSSSPEAIRLLTSARESVREGDWGCLCPTM